MPSIKSCPVYVGGDDCTVLCCTVLYCTVPGISCPVYVGGDGCTLMVAIIIVFVVIVGVILTVL